MSDAALIRLAASPRTIRASRPDRSPAHLRRAADALGACRTSARSSRGPDCAGPVARHHRGKRAGKSTLLKIIAGGVRPSAGTVEVNGRVGRAFELAAASIPTTPAARTSTCRARSWACPRRGARSHRLDHRFGDIGEHIDEPIKHYSSGMVVRRGSRSPPRSSPGC